jgi:hypothetical protein
VFISGIVGILQMHARKSLPVPLERALRTHLALTLGTLTSGTLS